MKKIMNKTKVQMMWEVSKEQEAQFLQDFEVVQNVIPTNINIEDLFKLIRASEYRRGKEDARKQDDRT